MQHLTDIPLLRDSVDRVKHMMSHDDFVAAEQELSKLIEVSH